MAARRFQLNQLLISSLTSFLLRFPNTKWPKSQLTENVFTHFEWNDENTNLYQAICATVENRNSCIEYEGSQFEQILKIS
jgi:hypothetical protein